MTIPASVTSIEEFAFYGCSGLTEMTVPTSVTGIGTSAFPTGGSLTLLVYSGSYARTYAQNNSIPCRFLNCTVSFDANGGAGALDPVNLTYGTSSAVPEITFARDGYSLISWNTEANGSGTSLPATADLSVLLPSDTENVTLYAQWTAGSAQYTVYHYYQKLDNTRVTIPSDQLTENDYDPDIEVLTGTTDTTVTPAVKSKAGYSAPAAKSLTILGNGSASASYYYYRNKYTADFRSEDGSVSYGTAQYFHGTPGTEIVLPANETVVKEPTSENVYSFNGKWSTDRVTALAQLPDVTADMVFYPVFDETARKYTVTFRNDDGTTLQSTELDYGTTPSYSGETPEKTATTEHSYTFAGWTPEITAVTADVIYTASYTQTLNKYTVRFLNDDGTVLQSTELDYGATPVYSGATPTKAATAQYTYAFSGWSHEIVAVAGNTDYTAAYSSTVNQYAITFVDEDGTTVLQSVSVPYGETPAYSGETPVKAPTTEIAYAFSGWTPALVPVTGDTAYQAVYSSGPHNYSVKFVNPDGTVLADVQTPYGTTPSYSGETPTRDPDAQYTYTFSNWTPEFAPVTGDATYAAEYTGTLNRYTVKFTDLDGTVLSEQTLDYGETPEYEGETPVQPSTERNYYLFSGWNPKVGPVTGDTTYAPAFATFTRSYVITWRSDDESLIDTTVVEYGSMPRHPDPVKPATEEYAYAFAGWTPDVQTVDGNATYFATYGRSVIRVSGACGEDVNWVLDSTGTMSVVGEGPMADYTEGEAVPWAADAGFLRSLAIDNGVTTVGKRAFASSPSLRRVSIPGSAYFVEDDAFAYCAELNEITLGDGILYIGENAFAGCASLTEAALPESVVSLGARSFADDAKLSSVLVPDSVRSIAPDAFAGDGSLTLKVYAYSYPLRYALENGIPFEIVAKPLKPGVKYVPYACEIGPLLGMAERPAAVSSVGVLPEGLTLDPETGKLSGVPMEDGNFLFTVTFTMEDEREYAGSFSLNIATTTRADVAAENDDGYQATTPLPEVIDLAKPLQETFTFVSPGSFDEFIAVYLNGRELIRDVEYTARPGSVIIELRSIQ